MPNGGRVNDAEANDGDEIAAQDVIDANPDGQVRFQVGKELPQCSVDGDSAVQVQPGFGVLLVIRKGVVSCLTSSAGAKNFVAGDTLVTAVDPVMLLGYDGQHATVRVAQGQVRVKAPAGTAILGPNQQTEAGSGEAPNVGPWSPDQLPQDQAAYINGLIGQGVSAARAPSYPRLSVDGSAALRRAEDRKSFVVALVSNDGSASAVTQSLLEEFLQHGAPLSVEVTLAAADQAGSALSSGDADLVVSDQVVGNNSIPLFTLGGATYRASASDDAGQLIPWLRDFLAAALQAECSRSSAAPAAAPGQSCYEHSYRAGVQTDIVPLSALGAYLGLS